MPEWTQAAKVGLFSIVLVGAAGGIYAYIGKTRLGAKGVTVYATFRDSTGLANFSRVTMAGIPVGAISGIGLSPAGKARVQIKLDKGVILHRDTTIAKQTATLLSEPFLGVTPGSADQPALNDGDEILYVVEPVTTDQIIADVAAITTNVKQITGSLANSIGSKEGEAEMKAILKNVEAATEQLAAISRENRQTIRSTFQNVEAVTADVRKQTPAVLENVRSATGRVDRILAQNEPDIRGTLNNTRSITEKVDRATNSLESTLQHVDHIADRIDRGEGTVGKLTTDSTLIDELTSAAEGVNDLVGGVSRLQTIVSLRSDYNFLSNSLKNYVEIRLQPREDKYYMVELVVDPRGLTKFEQTDVDTTNPNQPPQYREVRTTTTNSLRFSLMIARRLGYFTGRFGIKESTGGIGLDTHLLNNHFEIQQDLFGFGEQLIPRYRVALFYEFIKRLWIHGGVDNILSTDRRDYFAGLNLRFNDEDLKSVLLFAPSP